MSAIGGVSDPHGVWCHFSDVANFELSVLAFMGND